MMSEYIIYTDGACLGNPGPGGWGVVATKLMNSDYVRELSGDESNTTNNRMELTAVIKGLSLIPTQLSSILVVTDSKYIVDAVNKRWLQSWVSNGWRKSDGTPALNADLWKKLHNLICTHQVQFQWVKGHAGHPQNERCDRIARSEAMKVKELYEDSERDFPFGTTFGTIPPR